MKLHILSLAGVKFQGQARGLTVKTLTGEITVLDHHQPMITMLAPGILTVTLPDGTKQQVSVTQSGLLEINPRNELTVLLNP